jgi:uncharacterized damage-inducible protein DinB
MFQLKFRLHVASHRWAQVAVSGVQPSDTGQVIYHFTETQVRHRGTETSTLLRTGVPSAC